MDRALAELAFAALAPTARAASPSQVLVTASSVRLTRQRLEPRFDTGLATNRTCRWAGGRAEGSQARQPLRLHRRSHPLRCPPVPPPPRLTPADVLGLLATPFKGQRLRQATAAIGFKVHGKNGGEWVLDPTQSEPLVYAEGTGAFARCPTRVYVFADVMPALVTAPELVPHLLETGEIVVEGDRAALVGLAQAIDAGPSQRPSR